MSEKYNVKRYKEFAYSGIPKRVYSDVPEEAHHALKELAFEHGLPISAMLGLLIADATEGRYKKVSKRKPVQKRTVKKSATTRKARAKKSSKK